MTAAPQPAAPPAPAGGSLPRLRVLVVEDNPADADFVRGLLALADCLRFAPSHASSVRQALRHLAHGSWDLVLLDLHLGDSRGLETVVRVRAAAGQAPIVVMTGVDERELALQALQNGAQDYLVKADIDARLLERSIRYAVERQKLRAEAERRYAQELELGRMKTQLVSVVSHEFANALSVIQCAFEILDDPHGADPEEHRRRVRAIIDNNIRGLGRTAKTLLGMGRLEAGKLGLHRVAVDPAAVMESHLAGLETLYQRKRLDVSLDRDAPPVVVDADPEALALIVSNLLTNAIKYTPRGGRIVAGARRDPSDPGRARLFVTDTGIGISPREQQKIFSGYYRTAAGRRAAEGFGLGLAFARALVEAHGGVLSVKSAPREGSTFAFELPVRAGG